MPSSSIRNILFVLFCLLFFTNCNSAKKNNTVKNSTSIDGEWQLSEFHSKDIKIDRSNQAFIPSLDIQVNENKVVGNDGCNQMYGSLLKLTDHEIEVSNIGATKVGCKIKNPYDQEYKDLIMQSRRYEISQSTLFLYNSQNIKLLEFERIRD